MGCNFQMGWQQRRQDQSARESTKRKRQATTTSNYKSEPGKCVVLLTRRQLKKERVFQLLTLRKMAGPEGLEKALSGSN